MQFSVGDKVVHPMHGPGRITAIERREFMDGIKRYCRIEIPSRNLTVYLPRRKMSDVGVRPAFSQRWLPRLLDLLRGQPQKLPDNYKERQEQVIEKLRTGHTRNVAEVVRDLAWHRHRAHLTKKDADLFRRGRELLAEELALVSGTQISDAEETIEGTLALSLAAHLESAEDSYPRAS